MRSLLDAPCFNRYGIQEYGVFSKFLDPKNDYAFKQIFGTEKNKDILIDFLNDMLVFREQAKIQTVSFLKPIQDADALAKKESIVDVLCQDAEGRQYIVEMQVAKSEGFAKRAQYYAAKAYTKLIRGEDYPNLKEIIFIAITNFIMFPNKKAYKSDHVVLDKETKEHDLKDFSFTVLELPKFKKNIDELETKVEKWAYFFKHADHTTEAGVQKLVGEDKALGKAFEQINMLMWSEDEAMRYEKQEKNDRDYRAVMNAARDDGIEEGIKAVLLSLLKQKFNPIPNDYLLQIEKGSEKDLMRWAGRVLLCSSLEEVFMGEKREVTETA